MALAEHHFISRAFPMFSIKFKALCLLVMLAGAVEVSAQQISLRAVYRPDPTNPATNTFVFPNSQGCGLLTPTCRANEEGIYIRNTIPGPIAAGPASRSTLMFRTSTEWRQVTLTNDRTGHTLQADMRLVGLAGSIGFTPALTQMVPEANGDSWQAYNILFGGRGAWAYPPSPCVGRRPGVGHGSDTNQWFTIDTSSTPCMLPVTKDIVQLRLSSLILIIERTLPRPQLFQAGRYTGTSTYTIGPGMDVDYGDAVVPSDPELTLNFYVDVDPIFKVEFPGGSNLLSLEPEGGWLNWLHRGRKPTRLWREQAFNFSTSIPFKMKLECEHTLGDNCAIAASDGHTVPVETRLTLPEGMRDTAGRPVRDYLMSRHDTPQFNPALIILGRQGKVHFEVPRPDMETMLDHAGKAYSGAVTLTWDAQL